MLPGEHSESKIQGWHRDRLAVIYVRQSPRQQVADHGEAGAAAGRSDRAGGPALLGGLVVCGICGHRPATFTPEFKTTCRQAT